MAFQGRQRISSDLIQFNCVLSLMVLQNILSFSFTGNISLSLCGDLKRGKVDSGKDS